MSWHWRNMNTGERFGFEENPVVLKEFLDETTPFEILVRDPITGMEKSAQIKALYPHDIRFIDFDGDGCNTEKDFQSALPQWLGNTHDADGDNLFTVIDYMYIPVFFESSNCQ